MSKLKTNKSAQKRILGRTKTGRYVAATNSAQHRTAGKSSRVLQATGKKRSLAKTEENRLKKLLPYL